MPENFIFRAHSQEWVPTKNAFEIHSEKLITYLTVWSKLVKYFSV